MQCCWLCDQLGHAWYVVYLFISSVHSPNLDSIADENKTMIAKSGALVPLTRLARSKDMRVQRNATGALLNMTHSGTSLFPFLYKLRCCLLSLCALVLFAIAVVHVWGTC
jgi:hypothetical protein